MAKEFSLASVDQGVSPNARVNHLDKGTSLGGFDNKLRQILKF